MEKEYADMLDQIKVWRPSDQITIDNPTSLKMIGRGQQGVVFQIDDKRCVKVYYNPISLQRELRAMQAGEKEGITPKVYFWGDNYLVMEYLTAPSLYDYLQKKPLTKDLSKKVIKLLETFAKVGYNRFDHSGRHIYLMFDGKMKVIDVVHIIKPSPVLFSRKLISDMGQHAETFIKHVKEISPKWYNRWVKHPDFADTMLKAKSTNS